MEKRILPMILVGIMAVSIPPARSMAEGEKPYEGTAFTVWGGSRVKNKTTEALGMKLTLVDPGQMDDKKGVWPSGGCQAANVL